MSTFDNRQKGFEKKFAMDQELKFKAEARRNKAIAAWAAEKLGIAGDDLPGYIKDVQRADFEEAGDEDVFRKLRADFDAKGVAISDDDIRTALIDKLAEAIEQIEQA